MKVALEILLQSGEGQYIEFKGCLDRSKDKPKTRTLKSIAKDVSICLAEFANADGGVLLLGVENNGDFTGCPYNLDQLKTILQIAADSWKNAVPYNWEIITRQEHRIAAFEVDAQANVFSLTDGRTPYRVNDQTAWLSAEDVRELKKSRSGTLVERTITSFSLSDLDPVLISKFRSAVGAPTSLSDEQVLIAHDLAVDNGISAQMTLAACLLFGKPPMTRFHERCGINFRKFDGITALTGARNNETMDVTVELPLPLLIEQTFHLVQGQIGISRKLRDLFFEERPEYPTFAWQEILINAVAHRNYSLRGNEIEIRMFDDRMEVKNPGLPPEPVTIEDLNQRRQVHASRNPRIMRALKYFHLVRERGEGLPRVFEETEESYLPSPELTAEGNFFHVVLSNTPIFDDETMAWLKAFPLEKLNMRQRRILAFCHQSGKGYFALRDYISENHIDNKAAKKEIQQMIERRFIEVVGNRKAAKYYPIIPRGSIEEKLQDFFSRHEYLTNHDYRQIVGGLHSVTASNQLAALVRDGLLNRQGEKRGAQYFSTEKLLKTK